MAAQGRRPETPPFIYANGQSHRDSIPRQSVLQLPSIILEILGKNTCDSVKRKHIPPQYTVDVGHGVGSTTSGQFDRSDTHTLGQARSWVFALHVFPATKIIV